MKINDIESIISITFTPWNMRKIELIEDDRPFNQYYLNSLIDIAYIAQSILD